MTTDLQRSRHVSLEFIVKLYVHLTLAIFFGGGRQSKISEYTVCPILPFLQYWVRSIVDLPDL